MMRVLSIGNSFSQDAHRWLPALAAAAGTQLRAVNLYVGGCSLEQHWENTWKDAAAYDYEINGENTGKSAVLAALRAENWDVITLQQVSHLAGKYESYMPYLPRLAALCRQLCPEAKLYLQQTWAYETDSEHPGFAGYHRDQREMHRAVRAACRKAAGVVEAAVIPTGDVIQHLRETLPAFDPAAGGRSLCRDGFHLSLDYGRYAAAATWFTALTGRSAEESPFVPPEADPALIKAVRREIAGYLG